MSSLLHNAALHDEILNKTLQIIVPLDIRYATEKALEMNTSYRRQIALQRIFETSLTKNPSLDITNFLRSIFDQYDENERHHLIFSLTDILWKGKNKISEENQASLLKYSRKIPDHSMRAEALSNLAAIWDNEKLIRTDKLVNEALIAWSQEDDLKFRISLGYDIVERISRNTKEAARQFLEKVQELYLLPGAALASGDLNSIYYYSLDIAIRSMTLREISNKDGILDQIYNLINRVPSRRKRINLYGQLIARSYTIGYSKEAEEAIRVKLLPEIEKIGNQYDRMLAIQFCLPVIFKYHKPTAYELVNKLPESIKNDTWLRTAAWSITKGKLRKREVDFDHLRIQSDYLTLKDFAYEAAKNINMDIDLFLAISAICRSAYSGAWWPLIPVHAVH